MWRSLGSPTAVAHEALHDPAEDAPDVIRLEPDLRMGEPQRGQPRRGVRLIPQAISRLLGGGAVIAEAVRLDHEGELGPEEVDLEPVHVHACLRHWQPGGANDRKEEPLELGVSEHKGPAVQKSPQGGGAWLAPHLLECGSQPLRIDQIELVGFVDRPFQLRRCQLARDVDEGAYRTGDPNPVPSSPVRGRQATAAMNTDARPFASDRVRG